MARVRAKTLLIMVAKEWGERLGRGNNVRNDLEKPLKQLFRFGSPNQIVPHRGRPGGAVIVNWLHTVSDGFELHSRRGAFQS